jgi:extracellular factor (EF) 3-hydroxypalmitic acid methyl ester biosynthesis protein
LTTLASNVDAVRHAIPLWCDSLIDSFRAGVTRLEAEVRAREASNPHAGDSEISEVANLAGSHLNRHFAALSSGLTHLRAHELSAAAARCRAEVGSVFDGSFLLARCFAKPLGYPGDYEMMNMIYAEDTGGTRLLGRGLGRYALDMPEGRAVRNRVVYLIDKITRVLAESDRAVRVLSVAAGPALEIQALLAAEPKMREDMHVVLLDQDPRALRHARERIATVTDNGTNITFLRRDIRDVITTGPDEARFDLIYSAGLFDYFSDRTARAAAARLFESLAPNGELVIGNFNLGGLSRALMELVLDWRLRYRTADDLTALYGPLGGNMTVEAEPTGSNLFAVIRR